MNEQSTVFIVDDDEAVRDSLSWLMQSVGLNTETFPSAGAFLQGFGEDRPGCLLLDIRMPGMSGLELQSVLQEQGFRLPLVVISGHADVPIRAGHAGCDPGTGARESKSNAPKLL